MVPPAPRARKVSPDVLHATRSGRTLDGVPRGVTSPSAGSAVALPLLRVAHLIASFHVGGLERLAWTLATCSDVIEGSVWGYVEDGEIRPMMERDGVPTRLFGDGHGRGVRPALPLALARALRRDRIDVLHTHHIGPFLYGAPAARLAGVAHVHTEHSREYYEDARWRRVGRWMPRTATVVCCSQELATWRREHFGDRALVVVNGVPVPPRPTDDQRASAREALGVPRDAFVVGAVARVCDEKDLGTLVRAFDIAAAEHPDAHLVLIGDGLPADEAALDAVIAGASLRNRVHRLGRRDDVPELLPGFDVISLSSRREGLPLALLEGMASGAACVATGVGEIPSMLRDGGGLTAPPSDVPAFAEQLRAYLDDRARCREDGAVARIVVHDRYSADAMCGAYIEAYRNARIRHATTDHAVLGAH